MKPDLTVTIPQIKFKIVIISGYYPTLDPLPSAKHKSNATFSAED